LGFKSIPTTQQINECLKLSLRHRLEWLEEANRFTYKALKGKGKKAWEAFRKGEI
jgi:hypothetical protein